jgi:hypothetical protein
MDACENRPHGRGKIQGTDERWPSVEVSASLRHRSRVRSRLTNIDLAEAAGAVVVCQQPLGNPVGRSSLLRAGGHQNSGLVAACSPGGRWLGPQRDHPLAGMVRAVLVADPPAARR